MEKEKILEKLHNEYCSSCGSQRCTGEEEWLEGRKHYRDLMSVHNEPMTTPGFEVHFTCPEWLNPVSVNKVSIEDGVAMVDKLELNNELKKEHVKRMVNKFQNDLNELHIEFSDHKEENSVYDWMKQWIDYFNENFKETENTLSKYFKFCEDEQHPNSISMVLKKPVSELSQEEKDEIVTLLCDVTNIEQDKIKKVFWNMNQFVKVRIYCQGNRCCFDDIQKSSKPYITINTSEISSIEPKTDWGFCENYWKYPYRELKMNNGDVYLCVLESANELEKILLGEDEHEGDTDKLPSENKQ